MIKQRVKLTPSSAIVLRAQSKVPLYFRTGTFVGCVCKRTYGKSVNNGFINLINGSNKMYGLVCDHTKPTYFDCVEWMTNKTLSYTTKRTSKDILNCDHILTFFPCSIRI